MKTPIDFGPGDVIVHDEGSATNESTWLRHKDGKWRTGDTEAVWGDDTAALWLKTNTGRLVHTAVRRRPPVELPTEPTLGWLNSTSSGNCLALWQRRHLTAGWGVEPVANGFRSLDHDVTAFVPAVAVPASALDELRKVVDNPNRIPDAEHRARHFATASRTFLAAVDRANGDAS